ncbi:hypothetical protein KKF91_13345 [Myxococcota bacterium]|nr:hypothetical protein [Myxococcota bacterium]MBU1431522.1 hypothetical protein [Myxococcota bacterium]MBU1898175.1 hypothetical protein [Myxococcota bacterium]
MRPRQSRLYSALLLSALSLNPAPASASALSAASPLSLEILESSERIFKRIGAVLDIASKLVALYETYQSIRFSDQALLSRFDIYFNEVARFNPQENMDNFEPKWLKNSKFRCKTFKEINKNNMKIRYFIDSDLVIGEQIFKQIDLVNLVVSQENKFFFDYMANIQYKIYKRSNLKFEENRKVCKLLEEYRVSKLNNLSKDESTETIYQEIESSLKLSIKERNCYPIYQVSRDKFFIMGKNGEISSYCEAQTRENGLNDTP